MAEELPRSSTTSTSASAPAARCASSGAARSSRDEEQEALSRWQRLSTARKAAAIGAFAVGTFGLGFTLGGLVFGRWRRRRAARLGVRQRIRRDHERRRSRGGDVVVEEYFDGDAETLRNTRSCHEDGRRDAARHRDRARNRRAASTRRWTISSASRRRRSRSVTCSTMSSCFECNDWDEASPGNEELMYPQPDWLAFLLGLPLRDERTFSYCTAGVVALGIGLERAVGEPLSTFAQRELFASARDRARRVASHSAGADVHRRRAPADEPLAALARRAVPARTAAGSSRRDWVAESLTPHARIDAETEYGYLWWLKRFARRALLLHDRSSFHSAHVSHFIPLPRQAGAAHDHSQSRATDDLQTPGAD